jgi:hypothetical protein
MEETQKPDNRQLKLDKNKLPLDKTKSGREKKEEKSEVGGHKAWVVMIFIVTIILGFLFSLKNGLPKFSSGATPAQSPASVDRPNLKFNLDLFGSKVYQF